MISPMGRPSFIEIYDNALSKKDCDLLISQFEKTFQVPGCSARGIDPEVKKSMELDKAYFGDNTIISNVLHPRLMACLKKYQNKYPNMSTICEWKYNTEYNFQKYDGDEDGYKLWHCEHGGNDFDCKRILAWMFYVNDAKSGTEFMHYPTIKAKRGRCVIWPAFWTHVHKGVTPNKGLKYIATGWVSYVDDGDNVR